MPTLITIPNELLAEIASYLDPLATSNLLSTCRSLSSRLAHTMLQHTISPKNGLHALHWAANRGHLSLLDRLLTLFPVDLVDTCGDTALYYACRGRVATEAIAVATVRLLLTHGANVNGGASASCGNHDTGSAPLVLALFADFPMVARMLLDAGADPNCDSGDNCSIVITAVRRGETEWLELLLDCGANVNGTGPGRANPLMEAVEEGNLEILQLLVARGADLRYVNRYGDTPLQRAITLDNRDIAEYLVWLPGVDLIGCDGFCDAPLVMAAKLGMERVVRALVDQGSPLDEIDARGYTALQIAVAEEWGVIEEILREGRANRKIVSGRGDTPLLSGS